MIDWTQDIYWFDLADLHLLIRHLILSPLFPVFLQQKPALQMAPSPTPPPHILYNPTQHMLTYSGFCPSGQTLPSYPNFPIPMQVRTKTQTFRTHLCKRTVERYHHCPHLSQHNGSYQPSATSQPVPEAGAASNPCLPEENQNQQPPQAATQPGPPGAAQDAGGYMLTPNAPALYGPSYSPFEKPPPYACWAPHYSSLPPSPRSSRCLVVDL